MKGIILAGGNGTRLYPVTKAVSKQLLPVYDKPMIYYPLSVLMQAGIREILIIAMPESLASFGALLGDGKSLGLSIEYAIQKEPRGIAEAFLIGEHFIGKDSVCLVLGDNIFFGHGLSELLGRASKTNRGATIFGYYVKDPERYGIIEFNRNGKVKSLVEKPKRPDSRWAITGLYFYNNDVIRIAKKLKPSGRGELEITDVNRAYLRQKKLRVEFMGHGYAWLDTGTHDALMDASSFIKTIEDRQGLKIGCIEEWAYRLGFIDSRKLKKLAEDLSTSYGTYLRALLEEKNL